LFGLSNPRCEIKIRNFSEPAAALGAELLRARRHRRLAQRCLAEKAGIGRMTLVGLEAGRGSLTALLKLLVSLEHRFADQPVDVELSRWIAQSRKSAGLSQEKLCAQAGISKPAIARIERGGGHVTTLVAVMKVLGLSPSLADVAVEAAPAPLPAPTARLLHGDCRDLMREFAEEGVLFDAIVTDPPYHLASISRRFSRKEAAPPTGGGPGSDNPYRAIATGFMQQTWDGSGVAFDADTWRAAYAVLKPGGYLAAFGGSRTFHRLAVAIEDSGFEIRDTIMWVHSSGFPKSQNLSGKYRGRGTALKPACEPIIIARKPLAETSVAANVFRLGTGAINLDACRVPTDQWIERGRVGRKTTTSIAFSGRLPSALPEAEWRKDRPTSRPGSTDIGSYTAANVRAGIRPPTSAKEAVEQ
jgi:transcriptional regulator with XRE-family HTH domain